MERLRLVGRCRCSCDSASHDSNEASTPESQRINGGCSYSLLRLRGLTGNWNGIELTESTMSTPCFRLVSWDTPYRYPIGSQMIHSDHVEHETLKLLKINLQPH